MVAGKGIKDDQDSNHGRWLVASKLLFPKLYYLFASMGKARNKELLIKKDLVFYCFPRALLLYSTC